MLDELESLQAQLPNGVDQIQTGKEQLQEIRQEKRLIRQIKQMDEEHKQIRAFPKQSLHSGSKEIRWDPKKPQRKGGKKWKKKREITEEQVKEYQMLLAQWMQLPKDALEILNEDMPWRIREWLYVCALDQISGAELQAMKPQGLKKIQDIRAKFLKQKFQDRQEIQTQMNALQKQMEEGIEKQATALSRLQEEVLQVLQYLEQEKQILKEWEEQLLENSENTRNNSSRWK